MIAALPMYDWPELRSDIDAFWAAWRDALRRRGIDAPATLARDVSCDETWRAPDLLVGQTCGWPFVDRVSQWTRLIATPSYAAEGCEGARYCSWVLARRDDPAQRLSDLAGRCFARNGPDSLSGWRCVAADLPDELTVIETGAHRASMRAVIEGRADAAAIDAICWSLFQRIEPAEAALLKPIARTALAPGLPLVTRGACGDAELAELQNALFEALADPAARRARAGMLITGAEILDAEAYAPLRALGDRTAAAPRAIAATRTEPPPGSA